MYNNMQLFPYVSQYFALFSWVLPFLIEEGVLFRSSDMKNSMIRIDVLSPNIY